MMPPIPNEKIDELRQQIGHSCMKSVCTRTPEEIELEREIIRGWATDVARAAVNAAFRNPMPKG